MYINYSYYKNIYFGKAIPEELFNNISLKASNYMDYVTFNRINEVTEDIKIAACEIADILYSYHRRGNDEIKSESSNKHSVTYSDTNKTIDQRKYEVVKMYLGNTGLLYRGV